MRKYTLSKRTRYLAAGHQQPKKRFFTKKMVWSIVLAAIMAFSIIGFIYIGPTSGDTEYNGFTLVAQGNPETGIITGWTTIVDGREIPFYNHPTDVLSINVSDEMEQLLRQAPVLWMTSDQDDMAKETIGLIGYEFQTILGSSGSAVLVGFSGNNTFNKLTVTCANATAYEPVIYLRTADENRIWRNDSCIHVEASSDNGFMRMRDRLFYAYYNIIP